MKYIPTLLLASILLFSYAQEKLPVVKATSNLAKIYGEYNTVSNWGVNPKLKLDVHTTGKQNRPVVIKFKTDVDSLSFKLAPGKYKDFVVLLNGKDSCLTRVKCPELKDLSTLPVAVHDTIPFHINAYNTNFLPVVLNGTDSLLLNFDSGATEVCIIKES